MLTSLKGLGHNKSGTHDFAMVTLARFRLKTIPTQTQ